MPEPGKNSTFGLRVLLVGIQTCQTKIWASQNLGLPYQNAGQKF
jgi:hypothetical protein